MELTTADDVQARSGEAAFILQLRPPVSDQAEALAEQMEGFTRLYLSQSPGDGIKFAPLGALTWALSAPLDSVDQVDAACDGLAATLFGDPASELVHLARQAAPALSSEAEPLPEADVDSDEWAISEPQDGLPEISEDLSVDDGWDMADASDADAEGEVGEPAPLSMDMEEDVEPAPIAEGEAELSPLNDDLAEDPEDAWDVGASATPTPDSIADEVQAADLAETAPDAAPETPASEDEEWDYAAADQDVIDIDALHAEPAAMPEIDAAEGVDLAQELAQFRQEMRLIAQSIPGAGVETALAEFQAGMESLSGELGQRVDGAAQRIESAVDRVDPERLETASDRVEQAANLIETSVQEALEALLSASKAMGSKAVSAEIDQANG